jgi:hypothetical protein
MQEKKLKIVFEWESVNMETYHLRRSARLSGEFPPGRARIPSTSPSIAMQKKKLLVIKFSVNARGYKCWLEIAYQ